MAAPPRVRHPLWLLIDSYPLTRDRLLWWDCRVEIQNNYNRFPTGDFWNSLNVILCKYPPGTFVYVTVCVYTHLAGNTQFKRSLGFKTWRLLSILNEWSFSYSLEDVFLATVLKRLPCLIAVFQLTLQKCRHATRVDADWLCLFVSCMAIVRRLASGHVRGGEKKSSWQGPVQFQRVSRISFFAVCF